VRFMAIEAKGGVLTAAPEEGKALVRLATLLRVDKDNDVVEPGFFPTAPPLKVSIQPYHNHNVPSMGHAIVWEDTAKGEVLARFEFNDSLAGQEMWRVLKWDYDHGPIQEFSWAFRPKPGAARQGTLEGHSVRFLGKAEGGSFGVDLLEAGPVLRGASINSGTINVRAHGGGAPLTRAQNAHFAELERRLHRRIAACQAPAQLEAKKLRLRFLERQIAMVKWRMSV
jgi:hypothetical protein